MCVVDNLEFYHLEEVERVFFSPSALCQTTCVALLVVRKNPAISLPQGPGASTCHITSSTPTTCPNGKINLGFYPFFRPTKIVPGSACTSGLVPVSRDGRHFDGRTNMFFLHRAGHGGGRVPRFPANISDNK